MAKKRQKHIETFTGIDRRRLVASSDPRSFFDALNVDILPGGDVRARDGLIKVVDLDPRSVGLYISGGGPAMCSTCWTRYRTITTSWSYL